MNRYDLLQKKEVTITTIWKRTLNEDFPVEKIFKNIFKSLQITGFNNRFLITRHFDEPCL